MSDRAFWIARGCVALARPGCVGRALARLAAFLAFVVVTALHLSAGCSLAVIPPRLAAYSKHAEGNHGHLRFLIDRLPSRGIMLAGTDVFRGALPLRDGRSFGFL